VLLFEFAKHASFSVISAPATLTGYTSPKFEHLKASDSTFRRPASPRRTGNLKGEVQIDPASCLVTLHCVGIIWVNPRHIRLEVPSHVAWSVIPRYSRVILVGLSGERHPPRLSSGPTSVSRTMLQELRLSGINRAGLTPQSTLTLVYSTNCWRILIADDVEGVVEGNVEQELQFTHDGGVSIDDFPSTYMRHPYFIFLWSAASTCKTRTLCGFLGMAVTYPRYVFFISGLA